MSRYLIGNENEGPDIPNKLGLTNSDEINQEEFLGFTKSAQRAIYELAEETQFTLEYLYQLHFIALRHMYEFAGQPRTVNMSKEGFAFPAAKFLLENLLDFEGNFLDKVNHSIWNNEKNLLDFLAEMHAELLYIHPFREGNGRVIRLFTRMIYLAKTSKELNIEKINQGDNYKKYISGVQQAATGEYFIMKELFSEL